MNQHRKGSHIGAITVFLTAVGLGLLFSALLAPRTAWGQTLGGRDARADFCGGSSQLPSDRHVEPVELRLIGGRCHPFHDVRGVLTVHRVVLGEGLGSGVGGHAGIIAPNASKCQPDGTLVSPRLLAIPVAAAWGASVYAIHADRQFHHEYIGAALLLSHHRWVQWVGVGIMADDAMQHLIQTRRPRYESPLHRAYAVTLYRWGVRP